MGYGNLNDGLQDRCTRSLVIAAPSAFMVAAYAASLIPAAYQ
jgi:hypothetical protein